MSNVFLRQLISGTSAPGEAEFHGFLDRVMQGEAAKLEVVAFLAGLSAKPLSAANVFNFASYVRRMSPPKLLPGSEDTVNIVGTGGGMTTFNISTAAAFVASAAGAKVLKSGSTAYSSQCGSLDVLRALEVPVPEDEAMLAAMVRELGIGFISASHYPVLLRRLAAMSLPLAFRDIAGFVNTVGPLLCPYQVSAQMIGVSRFEFLDVFADAVMRLMRTKTLLVRAGIGMDELCSFGANHCRLIDGSVRSFMLSAEGLGFAGGSPAQLAGGDVANNAAILREVLAGSRQGAARDTVVLNSAALLFIAGVTPDIKTGIRRAADAIDGGRALGQLERVIDWGREVVGPRASVA
jgi:anthranilate phosphoribosyltransferase